MEISHPKTIFLTNEEILQLTYEGIEEKLRWANAAVRLGEIVPARSLITWTVDGEQNTICAEIAVNSLPEEPAQKTEDVIVGGTGDPA